MKTKTIEIDAKDVQPGDKCGKLEVVKVEGPASAVSRYIWFNSADPATGELMLFDLTCVELGLRFYREVPVEPVKVWGTVYGSERSTLTVVVNHSDNMPKINDFVQIEVV